MISVIRLGEFCKFLVTYFLSKVAQMSGDFSNYFENVTFQVETAVATFWGHSWRIWATFYVNLWSHWMAVIVSGLGSNPTSKNRERSLKQLPIY